MQSWSALMALVIVPICYLALCTDMRAQRIPRPPYVPYFFLFGTVGGWFLALMLSPSGLAAACFVFLITLAPLALMFSATWLATRPERTRYHRIAMWGGFGYLGVLAAFFAIGSALRR